MYQVQIKHVDDPSKLYLAPACSRKADGLTSLNQEYRKAGTMAVRLINLSNGSVVKAIDPYSKF